MKVKKSQFVHEVSVGDGYVAFYNSLNLEVIFLESGFIDAYRVGDFFTPSDSYSELIFSELKNVGMFIDEKDDDDILYRKYQDSLNEPAINILYLLLSDACNIRCKYCYFLAPMANDYKFSFMDSKTAKGALDLFVRCVKESVAKGHPDQHIVIYGGEPTLNKKVLIETLQYIDLLKEKKLLPMGVSVTLNTNGILLDKNIISQCKKTGVIIAMSIDGPADIHNQMRVFSSGKGTFDEVINSYRLAQREGVKVGICVTIDKHNISRMEEVIRWIDSELSAKGMGFNILIDNMTQQEKGNEYANIVAEELIKSFKIARELGIYEDRMMRRVNNFIDKAPVLSDCGGCGLQVVISPDGKIGVCQAFCGEKDFFVSESLETFEPVQHLFWKQWRKRSPFSNDFCKQCIALGNCGGGCPYNAYKISGSIDAIDERFCAHAKATTHFLIQDLWEKTRK